MKTDRDIGNDIAHLISEAIHIKVDRKIDCMLDFCYQELYEDKKYIWDTVFMPVNDQVTVEVNLQLEINYGAL